MGVEEAIHCRFFYNTMSIGDRQKYKNPFDDTSKYSALNSYKGEDVDSKDKEEDGIIDTNAINMHNENLNVTPQAKQIIFENYDNETPMKNKISPPES